MDPNDFIAGSIEALRELEKGDIGWTDWNYFTADAVTRQETYAEGSGSH